MTATNPAWGGATLTVLIGGVDVTCDVIAVDIQRQKNRLWDPPDTGTCQVTLNIGPGGQAPTTGPLGASLRVKIAYGSVNRWLFTGTVQSHVADVSAQRGDVLVLLAVDEMEAFGRLNRRAASTDVAVGAGDSVDQRIHRWLDEAGSTSTRAVGVSDFTCPATLIDGNILRQLQVSALADGGDFYVAGDGTVTFLPWNWRMADADVVAIFSDRRLHEWVPYSAATFNDDLDEVQNTVTGTRRDDGGATPVPQTSTSPSSVSTYGERGDPLDDLELATDGQVATRVDAVVSVAAFPNPRMDAITIEPAFDPARSWPRTLPVTFGALVAANRLWADGTETALYGHVIGERWTITPSSAAVEWRCTGTGTWDGYRPPRPPIAIEYCADGTIRVPDGYPCDTTSEVVVKDCDGNVLATYPPGSLCDCGTVELPEGACVVCYDDGTTQVCTSIEDPRLKAVLWLDVLDPGPNLIERIDGDAVHHGPEVTTRIDVVGTIDAIDASSSGAVLAQHSDHVAAASFDTGFSFDFYMDLSGGVVMDPDTSIDMIDLGVIRVRLRTTPGGLIQLVVWVVDDADVEHGSGVVWTPALDDWHHYIIRWLAAGPDLIVLVDGLSVYAAPFLAGVTPGAPSGDWGVVLPGLASVGQVLVYAGARPTGDYDPTVIADGPFAYWPLDTESGGTLVDYDAIVVADGPFAYWALDTEVP